MHNNDNGNNDDGFRAYSLRLNFCLQCLHLPEVYDNVDAGAPGRFHTGISAGVPVAMLAVFWERVHHFPLPRAGEDPCSSFIFSAAFRRDDAARYLQSVDILTIGLAHIQKLIS